MAATIERRSRKATVEVRDAVKGPGVVAGLAADLDDIEGVEACHVCLRCPLRYT